MVSSSVAGEVTEAEDTEPLVALLVVVEVVVDGSLSLLYPNEGETPVESAPVGLFTWKDDTPCTTRRVNDNSVTDGHVNSVLPTNVDNSAVFLNPVVQPPGTILAAFQALRLVDSSLRQDGHLQRLGELDVSNDTVPTVEFALTTGTFSDSEISQDHRVSLLKHLDIGHSGVGHVRVHTRRTVEPLTVENTSTVSTSDGFVVAEPLDILTGLSVMATVAEGQVVAVTLGVRLDLEGLQHGVGDPLRSHHVPSDNSGTGQRRQQRALWNQHLHWVKTALVQRDVLGDQATETVDDSGEGYGLRGVQVAVHLRRRPVEIKHSGTSGVNGDLQLDPGPIVHEVGHLKDILLEPVTDLQQLGADRKSSVGLNGVHVEHRHSQRVLVDHALDDLDPLLIGRHLGFQIGQVVADSSGPGTPWILGRFSEEQLHHSLLVKDPIADQQLGMDDGAFFP
ncbi:hypothetical protein WICPIJ_004492 [Wickerhamomyces pijperi]|uniref:Uncharacterized protein n=1 Tax=Wickerhamomyces pijperi TaxID=599730 RepID=A0A9P8Q599_WICPI|nr:hypothetical protein WICPIJ_004492 [Wickerhamomyces pijperi]